MLPGWCGTGGAALWLDLQAITPPLEGESFLVGGDPVVVARAVLRKGSCVRARAPCCNNERDGGRAMDATGTAVARWRASEVLAKSDYPLHTVSFKPNARHTIRPATTNARSCAPAVRALQERAAGIPFYRSMLLASKWTTFKPMNTRPVVPLNRCLNLAPAGTGTQFVYEQLKDLPDAASFISHDHNARATEQSRKLPNSSVVLGTRCIILTLREPSERLASGMRWDSDKCRLNGPTSKKAYVCLHSPQTFAKNDSSMHFTRTRYSSFGVSLSTWIDGMRNESAGSFHERSVAALESRNGHNFFQFPQLDYLRGIAQCNVDTEVHILCTESLTDQWKQLLEVFGETANLQATANDLHTRNTSRGVSLSRSQGEAWAMSNEDRGYVRDCLFPQDALLHSNFCGREALGAAGRSFMVPRLPPADCAALAVLQRG